MIAVLTVAYPAVLPYLADFAASIQAQTDKDFILYVGNDRVSEHVLRLYFPLAVIVPVSGTIAAARKQMIQRVHADRCDRIVFADCDDMMGTNRVQVSRWALEGSAFVASELVPFGGMGMGILSENLNMDLLDQNCCGLGNTAAWTDCIIDASNAISDNVEAFDWALFYRASLRHAWTFTTNTATYYRQSVGPPRNVTRLKRLHYEDLKDLKIPRIDRRAAYFAEAERKGVARFGDAPGYWWRNPIYTETSCP